MRVSPWVRWGGVLGLALGGFFDGILLHQILQWHHLLSLVAEAGDLRMQVVWDGYFHALMYFVAAIGLWGLWRARRIAPDEARGRPLGGALLIGFGLWHVLDAVLSHWLLGIHRIRVDTDNPLLWDLIWFVGFGLAPLIAGWIMLRRPGDPSRRTRHAGVTVALLGLVTTGLGVWALQPPNDQPFTTIVFRPGIEPPAVMAALAETGSRLVWSDSAMGMVVVETASERRWDFFRHGAVLVSGAGVPAGCFNWSRL